MSEISSLKADPAAVQSQKEGYIFNSRSRMRSGKSAKRLCEYSPAAVTNRTTLKQSYDLLERLNNL